MPVAHDAPDGVIRALNQVHRRARGGRKVESAGENGIGRGARGAVRAIDRVAVAEVDVVLVVRLRADLVGTGGGGVIEAMVDQGEVVGVDGDAAVGDAVVVGEGGVRRGGGKGGVGVGHGARRLALVSGKVCGVGEGRGQRGERIDDVVVGKNTAVLSAVGCEIIRVVVDVEAERLAKGIH